MDIICTGFLLLLSTASILGILAIRCFNSDGDDKVKASWGEWTEIGDEFDAGSGVWTITRSRQCLEDRSGNIVENRHCGGDSEGSTEIGYRWGPWSESVVFDSGTGVWTYTTTRSCLEDVSGSVADNSNCGGGVGGTSTVEKYRWGAWSEVVTYDAGTEIWTYTNTRDCLEHTSGNVVDASNCGGGAGGTSTVDYYRWGPWNVTGETFDDLNDVWTITKARVCVDNSTGDARDNNFCGGGNGNTTTSTFKWNTSPAAWGSGKTSCTNFPGSFILWGDIEGTNEEFDAVYEKLEISGELWLGIERAAGTTEWMTVSGNEVSPDKMNWASGFPTADTSNTLRVYVTLVSPSYYELKHDAGSTSRKYICNESQ